MSGATRIIRSFRVTVVAALAAAVGAGVQTAAAGGPAFTMGSGCAVQCITKALVIPTATTATVELATNVTAHLAVTVSPSGHSGAGAGGLTTNLGRSVSVPAFSPSKTASFDGLQPGTARPGVWFSFDVRGPVLDLRIVAEECDALLMKNCLIQAGQPSGHQHEWTVGKLDRGQILGEQALPPWHGTGVIPPAGHDGYAVLATEPGAQPAFLALATVDLSVRWPS